MILNVKLIFIRTCMYINMHLPEEMAPELYIYIHDFREKHSPSKRALKRIDKQLEYNYVCVQLSPVN